MAYHYKCNDGFCGADDCYRCHPEHFVNGVYYEDEDSVILDDDDFDDDDFDDDDFDDDDFDDDDCVLVDDEDLLEDIDDDIDPMVDFDDEF